MPRVQFNLKTLLWLMAGIALLLGVESANIGLYIAMLFAGWTVICGAIGAPFVCTHLCATFGVSVASTVFVGRIIFLLARLDWD